MSGHISRKGKWWRSGTDWGEDANRMLSAVASCATLEIRFSHEFLWKQKHIKNSGLFSQEAEQCFYQVLLRYPGIQRATQFMTFLSFLSVFRRCWDTEATSWMELDWGLYWSRWAFGQCRETYTHTHTHTTGEQSRNDLHHIFFNNEMLYFSHWRLLFVYLMVYTTHLILSLSRFHNVRWSWLRLVAHCQACWDSTVVLVGCCLHFLTLL